MSQPSPTPSVTVVVPTYNRRALLLRCLKQLPSGLEIVVVDDGSTDDTRGVSWETGPLWAIVFDGKVEGGISLRIDVQHEIGEIGYSKARPHWGKGLMQEACRAVIEWGFAQRSLAKLLVTIDSHNSRSLRVAEKLGMTQEGVLRSHVNTRDGRADFIYYGLLREEWM